MSYEREWRSFSKAEFEFYSQLQLTPEAEEKLKNAKANGESWLVEQIKKDHTYRLRRPSVFGHKALNFAKESLEEVIFGARMTNDDVKRHMDFIKNLGYVPQFYRVVRNPKRYALIWPGSDVVGRWPILRQTDLLVRFAARKRRKATT